MVSSPLLRTYRVLAFMAVVLIVGRPAVSLRAEEQPADRTKQIAELEKQLAELKTKLDELKKEPAKTEAPKPLQLADMLTWRSIRGAELSPDGNWFAYRVGPFEGDGEVIVRQTKGDKEHKFPAGSLRTGALDFTKDSKWFACLAGPPTRRGPGAAPTTRSGSKLILLNLTTGTTTEIESVRRFVFSGEAANWIAIQKSPAEAPANPALPASAAPPVPTTSGGNDLVLRELSTGNELTLGNVGEFAFNKKGEYLAITIEARDPSANAVQLRSMTTAVLHQLDGGKASYQSLIWSEKGDGLTVLKGVEDKGYEGKLYSILAFTQFKPGASPQKSVFDPKDEKTFPKNMTVSANRGASFTDDLSALVFGIQELKAKQEQAGPPKETEPKKEDPAKTPTKKGAGRAFPGLGGDATKDKPDLVIWHWHDERLQSQQQVEAAFEKLRSDLCTFHLKNKKFVRLGDDKLRSVSLAAKQRWAIGLDTKHYQLMSTLDGKRFQDVYVIDAETGARRLAVPKNRWFFGASTAGTHLLYYENGHFFTQEMASGKTHNITQSVPVSFVDVEDDHNVDRPPIRPMGWTKDGNGVLLSDGWDIWQVPVEGGPGVNLTLDGRKEGIRYRSRISLDPQEKGFDPTKPAYFAMEGEWTKRTGIGRLDPGKPGIARVLWDDKGFSGLMKAEKADVFAYRCESCTSYPEYCISTDAALQDGKKITNTNPQQAKYTWSAGSQLINYTNAKGDRLQAALFLPAGYEKGKKYPAVVYIYETLSDRLNRYLAPGISGFNPALYTSNGYAVLMPDIRYRINDPGLSSKDCVLAALDAAIKSGVVDKDKVGLQGHSWGGYQTAFLITQTDAFKAACAGAPLTNLVSMYSSIYWNSGSANQPIFESSQGRFTSGYWDNLEAYIRNSPVFHAPKVKTPLLLLHNDKDGAVDWNQGIEYFNTLRRLQKPVVMLQYKGENHGLAKPANMKDYTVRMKEFFDHHLMGKPAPTWLKEGVPHLKIDEHLKERAK